MKRVAIERLRGGARESVEDVVADEAPLEICLAGRAITVLMRTPGDDEDLVRGFLYTENLIAAMSDIVSIVRPEKLVGDERGNVLDVTLRAGLAARPVERLFYASSSCGVCGKSSISSLAISAPIVSSSLRVSAALLAMLPDRLRAAQPTFAATGGLHASGLFSSDGTLLVAREDVGRHNALDKVIGWALAKQESCSLSSTILVVSGRTSYEIIQKSISARIPMIVAVGAPSSLAVDLAEQFGITLVGFVRNDNMNLYSGAERVAR